MTSRIEQRCIDKGMKMTEQRRVIARVLSDAADHPEDAAARVAFWRRELDACYAGRPGHAITIALAEQKARLVV